MLFGTQRGSIGTIIEVPEKTYKIMSLLEKAMDKAIQTNTDVPLLKREGFRQISLEQQTKFESTNFIDGDFLQSFLLLDPKKQISILHQLFQQGSKEYVIANPSILIEVKQTLSELRDKH